MQQPFYYSSAHLADEAILLIAGQLPSGTPVNLHLWLIAETDDDTIRIQGFGTFESLDNMIFNPNIGQTAMSHEAMHELHQSGMLYFEVPSDKTRIQTEIYVGDAPPIAFHLECHINKSQVTRFALIFHWMYSLFILKTLNIQLFGM